jgi:hypothetical protein
LRCVQIRVAQNLVEVVDREIILRAFVLQNVDPFEYSGDVLFDNQIRGLFDDDQIDFQRLRGKLIFADELKGILVLFQFQLEGLDEGGVPGDGIGLLSQGEPPARRVAENTEYRKRSRLPADPRGLRSRRRFGANPWNYLIGKK